MSMDHRDPNQIIHCHSLTVTTHTFLHLRLCESLPLDVPTVDDDSTVVPKEKQDETNVTDAVVDDETKAEENSNNEELKEERLTTVEEQEPVDEESEPITDSEPVAAKALQIESDSTADSSQGFVSHFYVAFTFHFMWFK